MVCSFSKQFYQHNNTIQSMCLVDSTHTPELCCYKGSQLYSQGTLQFPVSGWPLPKSYLGFMWCSQTLTLHCSFGNSFTLLPAKWLLEMPFFGFFFNPFLPVIPFSCPLTSAKHPWHLWSETILAHLLDCGWFYRFGCFCCKTLGPFLRLLEAKDGVIPHQQVWLSLGFAVSHVKDALWSHWRCAIAQCQKVDWSPGELRWLCTLPEYLAWSNIQVILVQL